MCSSAVPATSSSRRRSCGLQLVVVMSYVWMRGIDVVGGYVNVRRFLVEDQGVARRWTRRWPAGRVPHRPPVLVRLASGSAAGPLRVGVAPAEVAGTGPGDAHPSDRVGAGDVVAVALGDLDVAGVAVDTGRGEERQGAGGRGAVGVDHAAAGEVLVVGVGAVVAAGAPAIGGGDELVTPAVPAGPADLAWAQATAR